MPSPLELLPSLPHPKDSSKLSPSLTALNVELAFPTMEFSAPRMLLTVNYHLNSSLLLMINTNLVIKDNHSPLLLSVALKRRVAANSIGLIGLAPPSIKTRSTPRSSAPTSNPHVELPMKSLTLKTLRPLTSLSATSKPVKPASTE